MVPRLRGLLRMPQSRLIINFMLLVARVPAFQSLIVVLWDSKVWLERALSSNAGRVNLLLPLTTPHGIFIEIWKFVCAIAVSKSICRVLNKENLNYINWVYHLIFTALIYNPIALISVVPQLILLLPWQYAFGVLCNLRSKPAFSNLFKEHLRSFLFHFFPCLLPKINECFLGFNTFMPNGISDCSRYLIDLWLEWAILSHRILFLLLSYLAQHALLLFFALQTFLIESLTIINSRNGRFQRWWIVALPALLCRRGSRWVVRSLKIWIRIKAVIPRRWTLIRIVQIKDLPCDIFSRTTSVTHNVELAVTQTTIPRHHIILPIDLSLFGHSLLMQPGMHGPTLLSWRCIAGIIEQPFMLDYLARVVVNLRVIGLLTAQLGRYLVFPLLVGLCARKLESLLGRRLLQTVRHKALVDHLRDTPVTSLPLRLQTLLHHVLIIRLI